MRVDVFGQVLRDGVEAVLNNPTVGVRAHLRSYTTPNPLVTVEPDMGYVWVHLEADHLSVCAGVELTETTP